MDDIVLVKETPFGKHTRFVQVKTQDNADKHWSIADLCAGVPASSFSGSILCKLFSKDTVTEHSDFRLLTNEGVNRELRPFHHKWRQSEPLIQLTSEEAGLLLERLRGWVPPRDRPHGEYVLNFRIEQHAADVEDQRAVIAQELAQFLSNAGEVLESVGVNRVADILYIRVHNAASADPKGRESDVGKLSREHLRDLVLSEAKVAGNAVEHAASFGPEVLTDQLKDAGYNEQQVKDALTLRRKVALSMHEHPGDTEVGNATRTALAEVHACVIPIALEGRLEAFHPSNTLLQMMKRIERLHSERSDLSRSLDLSYFTGLLYWLIARGSVELVS